MRAGIEELLEIFSGFADPVRAGDADAVETERLRFALERGLQVISGKFDGLVQKSRST
ncbi:hypothetical protein [Bradyrhizobium sp. AZCC 2176]|uniref:hypothetical protein n=1 Tax=Bradyrhizobium sp. AZCC 2176 TaxID=3117025 RepID=UPI002FF40FFB